MKDQTNEFSFVLKPSQHGVGVFATHDIEKGSYLRLFAEEKVNDHHIRLLKKDGIPEKFRDWCLDRGDSMLCPPDFGAMPIGWYLNHSTSPNASHKGAGELAHRKYVWYASRDITAGEEIFIDYNSLEEPDEAKEEYYHQ